MKKSLVTLLVIVFASAALFAQEPLRKKHFNLEKGIVLQQYDPVADFTKNKAIEGKMDWQ